MGTVIVRPEDVLLLDNWGVREEEDVEVGIGGLVSPPCISSVVWRGESSRGEDRSDEQR